MNFDNLAANWDDEKRIVRAKEISEKIKEVISKYNKNTAMEFGCGTGLITFNIADAFDNITLIDSSQKMIDIVFLKMKKSNLNNIHPVLSDLTKENYLNKKFNVIYSSMAIHHIVDVNEMVKKLFNMLEKNGCLCIVDLNKDDGSFHVHEKDFKGHDGFSKEEIFSIFENAGFQNIEIDTFYKGEKCTDGKNTPYSLFCIKGEKL